MPVSGPDVNRPLRWMSLFLCLALSVALGACDSGGSGDDSMDDGSLNCAFPVDFLNEGANRGSITPVNNPVLVGASAAEKELPSFSGTDRVLGLPPSFHEAFGNTPLAVPLDVLFESEVINTEKWGDRPLAITFCPLTSSTLVFDRMAVDGAQFEISGLLLNKGNEDHLGNLVMIDTDGKESLWPRMSLGSVCGPDRGTSLNVLPAVEMRWERWKELYSNTEVATEGDGSESTAAAENGWQTPPRTARPKMDDEVPLGRVLGIPGRSRIGGGTGGFAFAFQDLDDGMPARVVEVTIQSETVTVFWNRDARAAMAFQTSSSFSVQNGKIVDDQTQSVWTVAGRAVEGTRQGEHLDPVKGAYIASGRAWFDFQPDSELWNDSQ